jgi:hypothetical protein
MKNNMLIIQDKIHQVLTDKYLMYNDNWTPFDGLESELSLIPEVYHNIYIRTMYTSDPMDDLMDYIMMGYEI